MPGKADKMKELQKKHANKPEAKSVRFQVLLTPSISAELEEWKEKTGLSKNEIVNEALERLFNE